MNQEDNNRLEEAGQLDLYRIELDSFQGPLDLLLHLIKKNELDIYDIPIAEITRQYVNYLEVMSELNLDVASEFLVMASTLIHLKSRMLLPVDEEEEEEEEGEDPREELIRRLLEYQKYKKAAEELGSRPALGRDVFARHIDSEGSFLFEITPRLDPLTFGDGEGDNTFGKRRGCILSQKRVGN